MSEFCLWRLPVSPAEKFFKGECFMTEVLFYNKVDDDLLKFAVIASRFHGKWVFCKHKKRNTYEIPGGHRERGENIEATARRELYEETGAARFRLVPVCPYSVAEDSGEKTYGMLYFSEIQDFFALPDFEMERIDFFAAPPENLTYPLIQPKLLERAVQAIPRP
jgi:8-oxo-dGTP diphosphatase